MCVCVSARKKVSIGLHTNVGAIESDALDVGNINTHGEIRVEERKNGVRNQQLDSTREQGYWESTNLRRLKEEKNRDSYFQRYTFWGGEWEYEPQGRCWR